MKTFTLSVILLAFCTSLFAGQYISARQNHTQPHFANAKQEQAFYRYTRKPDGRHTHAAPDTLPRLTSTRTDTVINLTSALPVDSSSFTFSGGRGGDDNHPSNPMHYDLETDLQKSGGQFTFLDHNTQTFDSNNNILTSTQQLYISGSWVNSTKSIYTYDALNHLTSDTDYQWISGAWVPQDLTSDIYDSAGDLLESTIELDSSGVWLRHGRYSYSYIAPHVISYQLSQTGNDTGWVNSNQKLYQFDNNNNDIFDISSYWSSGAWVNSERDSFSYNAANKETRFVWQNYSGGSWVNIEWETYNYNATDTQVTSVEGYNGPIWYLEQLQQNVLDANGNVLYSLYLQYGTDTSGDETSTYNADNQSTSLIRREWRSPGVWLNESKNIDAYDSRGNMTLQQVQNWNGASWGMDGDFQYIDSFNNYDQYVYTSNTTWITASGGFVPIYNNYYWYNDSIQQPLGITELKTINSCAYPNPFSNTFTVSYDADCAGQATLKLYDINGRLITRTVTTAAPGSNTITWDAGHTLPAGTYIYELTLGNEVSKGKLVSQ